MFSLPPRRTTKVGQAGSLVGFVLAFVLVLFGPVGKALAAEANIAVASNFSEVARLLAKLFEQQTVHRLRLSFGSTGKLHAQIKNGAPFAVLLSADQKTPGLLVADGLAVVNSRFSYAQGKLVMWSASPKRADRQGQELLQKLSKGRFRWLAIANPAFAPYGLAARAALESLGLLERVRPRLVRGESVAQAYQFVASGNADLGFVALSQVMRHGRIPNGLVWVVPQTLYPPIRQDAVLLNAGRDNPAAAAWMSWLQDETARALMRQFGYTHQPLVTERH